MSLPSAQDSRAWEIFDAFLERSAAGDPQTFEELLASHPAHAAGLRALWTDYRRSAELLARFGTDEAERLLFDAALGAASFEALDLERLCRDHEALAPRLRELHGEAKASRARLREAIPEPAFAEGPIAGRFTPLTELGRGGMSIVLAAWDSHLRRKVALKCLRPAPGSSDDPERLRRRTARLLHEAQVLAQLDHPGIVPVYDVVRDRSGAPFVAMLRVRGVDLRAIYRRSWQRDAAWPLPRVVGILHRICEALAYAHGKGVLHRDLKPANVMVGSFGEAYLMDWGLARTGHGDEAKADPDAAYEAMDAADASLTIVHTDKELGGQDAALLTQRGEVLGTPSYMSPEQAAGRIDAVGPHSDVYGIGAMLYELLAGHAPYARPDGSSSSAEILSALRAAAPSALSSRAPSAPGELVAIAEKAMARDPARRYVSMRELAEELRAYLEGRVVRAHRTGAFAELRKWIGRHRGLAAALLALCATLGIALAVALGLLGASERNLYLSRIAQAASAFEAGRFAEMREALHECGEEHRDWEWGHLLARSDDCIWHAPLDAAVIARHPGASDRNVHALDVSPDGSLVAVAHRHGVIRLLDARDGSPRGELLGHRGGVSALAFLPREPLQLLSGSWDKTVKLWDVLERRVVREWMHDEQVHALAIGQDGGTAVSGTRNGRLQWIDLADEAFVRRLDAHSSGVTALAISPDGQRLASAGMDLHIALWDWQTGERQQRITRSMPGRRIGGQDVLVSSQPILGLSFHHQAEFLFSASQDGFGKMWDLASSDLLFFEPMGHPLGQMAVSPNGAVLAIGGQDLVRLRTTWDGRPLENLRGHVADGGAIAWGPDSELLVAGAADGSVRAYRRTQRGGAYFFAQQGGKVWSIAVSGDGSTLASSDEKGGVMVFRASDLSSIRTFRPHAQRIRRLALDQSGHRLATASDDRTVRIFDVESGRELAKAEAPDRPQVWWRDRTLVLLGESKSALVLDDQDLARRRELPLAAPGKALALDGRGRIAVGDAAGSIRIFEAGADRPAIEFVAHPKSTLFALTFLSDGTLASSGADSTVSIWSLPSGERLVSATGIGAQSLVESTSGRRLLAVPLRDNPRVLQREDLRTLIELVGHEPGVLLGPLVALDDDRFVSGDSAGALRVWSQRSLRTGD
ncbi:MAG: protein kinase [Planctomycetes bacterium]|nr:protein kinase [Planctomycetota bacterium]